MKKHYTGLSSLLLAILIAVGGCSGFGHSATSNQNQDNGAGKQQTADRSTASQTQSSSQLKTPKNGGSSKSSSSQLNSAGKSGSEKSGGNHQKSNAVQLVQQIVLAAKKGKVINADFTSGQTTPEEIRNEWGNPSGKSDTGVGTYAVYKKQNISIGYSGNSPIFDLRSFDDNLKTISLSEIQQVMGKPGDIHFYKDADHNQEILIYPLSNSYQLEWVIKKPSASNPNPHVDHISVYDRKATVDSLVNRMTLDEKIGQLVMVGVDGTSADSHIKTLLQQDHVGGIILYGKNIKSTDQTVKLINQLKAINTKAGNPLPVFFSVDQEGGRVQRLPANIVGLPSNGKVGKINDSHFSYQIGQIIGKELKAFGFNMDFAPVLDITDPSGKSVIGDRSFGSDKNVVGKLGTSTMQGIQSEGVVSVVKHFPGYGPATVDAHSGLPKVTLNLSKLANVEWYPYKKAIDNGADAVMVTHILLPNLDPKNPASMSRTIITGMLRKKLGFHGVVITDDMTMGAIEKNYNINQAAVKAVEAGADIVLVAFNYQQQISVLKSLKHAVETGEISKTQLNDSVERIIRLKKKYKLSDRQQGSVNVAQLNRQIKTVLSR